MKASSVLLVATACLFAQAIADDSGEFESGEVMILDVMVPHAIPSVAYSTHHFASEVLDLPQVVPYSSLFSDRQTAFPVQTFIAPAQISTFRKTGYFQRPVTPVGAVSNAIGSYVSTIQPQGAVGGFAYQQQLQQPARVFGPQQTFFPISQGIQPQFAVGGVPQSQQQQLVGGVAQFTPQGIYPAQFQSPNAIRNIPQYVAGQQGFVAQQGFVGQQSFVPQQTFASQQPQQQFTQGQSVQSGQFAATHPTFTAQTASFLPAQTGQRVVQPSQIIPQSSSFVSQPGIINPSPAFAANSQGYTQTQQFVNAQNRPFGSSNTFPSSANFGQSQTGFAQPGNQAFGQSATQGFRHTGNQAFGSSVKFGTNQPGAASASATFGTPYSKFGSG